MSANLYEDLDLVTEEATAVLLDVSIETLRNQRTKRVGPPFVKLGRITYYSKTGLKAYVEKNTVTTDAAPTLTSGSPRRSRASVAA